jgi:hypothetical protein
MILTSLDMSNNWATISLFHSVDTSMAQLYAVHHSHDISLTIITSSFLAIAARTKVFAEHGGQQDM